MKTRQYNNGDTCSVSANPGSHYTFDGWFENDSIVSSDNPYSFTVSGDRTLEGKFTANSYTITTNVSPVSGGSISGGGTYDYGDTCTLTATSNQDYRFATWTDGDGNFLSNDNPFSFTVSGDLTVRGVFSTGYNTYTITVISSNGSVSGDGVYALDDTCTLTSTPNPGYLFDHWEMNGIEISDDNPYSFTVDGDKTITAVYEVSPASLKITTNGPASFTLTNSNNQTYTWVLSSGDNYYYGDEPGFALNEITGIKRVGANNTTVISADISELTSMTTLPIEAFDTCKNLESIILPDSLTTIEMNAFWGCNNLETINLPNSLTSIGICAFSSCTSLTSITLPNSLTSIGIGAFGGSGLTSINLPNSITFIGNNAFAGCTSLTSITLPNSLTTLEYGLFQGSGLTSITIPSSITTWSSDVFYNCTSLESITIPEGITAIGVGSFDTCESLTSTTLPASLTSIGDYAFYGCISQESITCLATTPPTLGYDVFTDDSGCNIYVPWSADHSVYNSYVSSWSQYASRIVEMAEPANLKIMTNNATYIFLYNSNLGPSIPQPHGVYLSSGLNKYYGDVKWFSINEITSVKRAGFSYDEEPNLVSIDASDLTSWTIIDQDAFSNCTSLTSITLPNSITTIGWYSFRNCRSLTSINFPNSLTTIDDYAFSNCDSLTSITLPNTITSIDYHAFGGCISLTSITCLAITPPTLGTDAFSNTNNCPIYVPAASLSDYQTEWSEYASRLNAL